MMIFQNAFEAGKRFPGSIVAIGKFDGMHRGHQKLLLAALRRARTTGTSCLAVTFDPSPAQFFGGDPLPPILTLAQKLERFAALGLDAAVLLPFDKRLACISPEGFARDVLALQLKPSAVCVGSDFCFGKDRAGRVETLQALGPGLGFSVHPVSLAVDSGEKISASRIRRLLDEGRRREAERLLGWTLPA